MLFVNKLTMPGDIKKLVLEKNEVTVITKYEQTITYRRVDDDTQKA